MCELLVGLPDVNVLGIDDESGHPLAIHVECRGVRPRCPSCSGAVVVKDRPVIQLIDLPAFGRPTRLMWRKHRWLCTNGLCPTASFTEEDPRIASPRMAMTSRAGRWLTEQIGRRARTVNENSSHSATVTHV
jgi:transposase